MHKFKDEEEYNQFLFKGFAYGINIRKMGSIEAIKQNFKHILTPYEKNKRRNAHQGIIKESVQQSNEESELLSPTKDEKIIEKNSNHAHSSSSQSFARKDEIVNTDPQDNYFYEDIKDCYNTLFPINKKKICHKRLKNSINDSQVMRKIKVPYKDFQTFDRYCKPSKKLKKQISANKSYCSDQQIIVHKPKCTFKKHKIKLDINSNNNSSKLFHKLDMNNFEVDFEEQCNSKYEGDGKIDEIANQTKSRSRTYNEFDFDSIKRKIKALSDTQK